LSSQIGAQACFTVLLSYLLGKTAVNLHMALSMIIIIAGVACSCVPLWVVEQSLDRASLPLFMPYLSQLFGTSLVLLSAAAAAARAVLEEVIMLEEDGLSPLTFAAATCAMSSTMVLILLLTAQLLPGFDHGVQVQTVGLRQAKQEGSEARIPLASSPPHISLLLLSDPIPFLVSDPVK
jgi:drug/metabolite transporter (DMT)-like permease